MGIINLDFTSGDNFSKALTKFISKAKQIKQEEDSHYLIPRREVKFFEVLVPFDKEINWNLIENRWDEVPNFGFLPLENGVIIHGHERDEPCRHRWMCHVYGYRPSGSEHPDFIRRFYEKWEYLRPAKKEVPVQLEIRFDL